MRRALGWGYLWISFACRSDDNILAHFIVVLADESTKRQGFPPGFEALHLP
jgi:hypothetical protein